jgi:hypothetical protein
LLSATYVVFGDQALNARYMIAVLAWLTALLLVLIGDRLAGWYGSLAGGIAGYYYLNFGIGIGDSSGLYAGHIGSEPVAALWVTLFTFLFIIYCFKGKHSIYLFLAGASLAALVLTKAHFLIALPLFLIYLRKHNRRELAIFTSLVLIPVIVWSTYASLVTKSLVIVVTQREKAIPRIGCVEVAQAFAPTARSRYHGFVTNFDEILVTDCQFTDNSGEEVWFSRLRSWDNLLDESSLSFRAELVTGDLYNYGKLGRLGIGLLLLAIGFRTPTKAPQLFRSLSSVQVLILQLALVSTFAIARDSLPFVNTLLIWLAILTVAVFRPYGDCYQPFVQIPVWFLIFLAPPPIAVLLSGGDMHLFAPLEPILALVSILMLVVVFEIAKGHEIWKRDVILTILLLILCLEVINAILPAILGYDIGAWLWNRVTR